MHWTFSGINRTCSLFATRCLKQINTYAEFLKGEEKISTNILADRLAMLECAGLLKSRLDEENKSRKIYTLTNKAIELLPAIPEIIKSSAAHDKKTAALKPFENRIKNDKENLTKQITEQLKANL